MSIFLRGVIAGGLVFALAACGSQLQSNKKSEETPKGDPTAEKQAFEALPAGVVMRVPVENGKEVLDKADTRLIDKDQVSDAATADAMWQSGKTPDHMVKSQDELDSDSSTQSWYYQCGYSYYYCNSYSYGSNYYRWYTPYSYWRGNYWQYSYSNYYNYNNYNYYYYQRSCYSYSWCGSYGY